MAKDCVDHAATLAQLDERPCVTRELAIHGASGEGEAELKGLIDVNPSLGIPLHDKLPITPAHVVLAARGEMARTIDDVLARRTRALVLNARAATEMAPTVADILAGELGRNPKWVDEQLASFNQLARTYLLQN